MNSENEAPSLEQRKVGSEPLAGVPLGGSSADAESVPSMGPVGPPMSAPVPGGPADTLSVRDLLPVDQLIPGQILPQSLPEAVGDTFEAVLADGGPVNQHWLDADGNPSGGTVITTGVRIYWQNGPLGRGANRRQPNGAGVCDVLKLARDRLEFLNTASENRFYALENVEAIQSINRALSRLEARRKNREERGVEGTHAQ